MVERIMRAIRGDVGFFEEAESNTSLTSEAMTIVGMVAAVTILSGLVATLFTTATVEGMEVGRGSLMIAAIVSGIWLFVGYLIWAWLTWFIGTRVFNGTADVGELQRTLGYAYAPQLLNILSFIPCVGALIGLVTGVWSLVLGVIAVRQALDFTTGKAIGTVLAGWLVIVVVQLILATIFGIGAVATGALGG